MPMQGRGWSDRPFLGALILGFLIWVGASIAFRLGGQAILRPEPWSMVLIYGAVAPAVAAFGVWLRRRFWQAERADSVALGFMLPGMLGDAWVILGYDWIFPNLDPTLDGVFGAALLWLYGLVGLAVALDGRRAMARAAA